MLAASSPSLLRPSQFLDGGATTVGKSHAQPFLTRSLTLPVARSRRSSTVALFTSTERPAFSKTHSTASLYDVLGLPIGASGADIKSAYRKLVRTCHPDVVATDRKPTSTDDFIRIHSAYSTLSDPEKRAEYDRNLQFRRSYSVPRGASSSYSPFSGYSSKRTWETDQCW